jgi:hypothetical protein
MFGAAAEEENWAGSLFTRRGSGFVPGLGGNGCLVVSSLVMRRWRSKGFAVALSIGWMPGRIPIMSMNGLYPFGRVVSPAPGGGARDLSDMADDQTQAIRKTHKNQVVT